MSNKPPLNIVKTKNLMNCCHDWVYRGQSKSFTPLHLN